jgi:hypothetical protein
MRKLALQMQVSVDALQDASCNQEPRGGSSASAVSSVAEEWT